MTPYEAYLAGGEFNFELTADPEKWSGIYNEKDVIWRQSFEPDNSLITMTFNNRTQFNGPDFQQFDVVIRNGLVAEITRQEN